MRFPALLASLAFVALVFAGCSGDGDGDGGETSSSSSSSASSTSATSSSSSSSGTTSASTTSTGPAQNQPPTGTISAAVNGTNATFTLSATDADGDALSWTLAFGDGSADSTGDELPATVEHAYAAGNFTANFTVSDGEAEESYMVDLAITSGGGGGEAIVFAGHVITPDPWAAALNGCLMDAGRRDAGAPGGVTGQDHPIEETQWGWNYALDTAGLIAEYWSEGDILGAGESGVVPDEAIYVVVCISDPAAADSDYQLTLTPP